MVPLLSSYLINFPEIYQETQEINLSWGQHTAIVFCLDLLTFADAGISVYHQL